MQRFANLSEAVTDPMAWARQREAEGYDGLGCSDHYWMPGRHARPFPHVLVTLAAMACATERVTLTPSFANNLFRSPVEFAQAALMLQSVSGGRFEAGLGAGWLEEELMRTGQPYPDGRTRARMLCEAVQIVRALVTGGRCTFDGEHYRVDVPVLGPLSDAPPPVVASVGSPWTMRNVTPLVDRVELKMGRTTRDGGLNFPALASITTDEVAQMVATVRDAKPGIPVSVLAFVAVGSGPAVDAMAQMLGDGFYGRMCGEATKVADVLDALADLGIDRVQVTEFTPGSFEALAETWR
jgi:alkanesulfonate monooxygenase SsuD/methylene tetrahydromethanopterin reductase-like flavin-dependent oxidoreductase (luciferase family)